MGMNDHQQQQQHHNDYYYEDPSTFNLIHSNCYLKKLNLINIERVSLSLVDES